MQYCDVFGQNIDRHWPVCICKDPPFMKLAELQYHNVIGPGACCNVGPTDREGRLCIVMQH